MIKWQPNILEPAEHQLTDRDYAFALERTAKVLYHLFRRFEVSRPAAPALTLPNRKEIR